MTTLNVSPPSALALAGSAAALAPPASSHTLFVVGQEARRFTIVRADERSRIPVFTARKTPIEEMDYGFDWSAWLNDGELISDSGWSVTPNDSTLTVITSTFTDTASSVWVLDGTPGVVYTLTNTVFTNSSPVQRHAQRSLQLLIVSVR